MWRLTLQPTRESGLRPVDVEVVARPDARVADLARALAAHLGAGTGTLLAPTTDGTPWPATLPLAQAPLSTGAVIPVATVPASWLDRPGGRQPVRARVRVVAGPDAGREVDVESDAFTVGRGASATVRLTDTLVSSVHARVLLSGGVVVSDEGSAHGTRVGGRPVLRARPVGWGERVEVGRTTFEVHRGDAAPLPADAGVLRPPRFGARLEPAALEVPAPPTAPRPVPMPWPMMLMPVVLGGAMFATNRSPFSLVFMLGFPTMMAVQHMVARRQQRSEHDAQLRAWRVDLDDVTGRLDAAAVVQRERARPGRARSGDRARAGRRAAPRHVGPPPRRRRLPARARRPGTSAGPRHRLRRARRRPRAAGPGRPGARRAVRAGRPARPARPRRPPGGRGDVCGPRPGRRRRARAAACAWPSTTRRPTSPSRPSSAATARTSRRGCAGCRTPRTALAAARAGRRRRADGARAARRTWSRRGRRARPHRVPRRRGRGRPAARRRGRRGGRRRPRRAPAVGRRRRRPRCRPPPTCCSTCDAGLVRPPRPRRARRRRRAPTTLDLDAAWQTARTMTAFRDEAAVVPPDTALPDVGAPARPRLRPGRPRRRGRRRAAGGPRRRGLRAQIGAGADGVVTVDLREDGPHGLVAGTTGSGKSRAAADAALLARHSTTRRRGSRSCWSTTRAARRSASAPTCRTPSATSPT